MSFGQVIDLKTGALTDDYIIGKAMEALRMRFRERLPESFYGQNWERARLMLKVEGRSTDLVASLLPFAEAAANPRKDWWAGAQKVIHEAREAAKKQCEH